MVRVRETRGILAALPWEFAREWIFGNLSLQLVDSAGTIKESWLQKSIHLDQLSLTCTRDHIRVEAMDT